jgi:lipopolysaccharide/colanic/teichoic acid biosynthesis glycosyltransferase
MQYLPLYSTFEAHRHDVRPGVTGLAQIRGRNVLSWPERFAADVEYVERRSLRLDACILTHTITSVLRREGITAPGEVTMSPFQGSAPREHL